MPQNIKREKRSEEELNYLDFVSLNKHLLHHLDKNMQVEVNVPSEIILCLFLLTIKSKRVRAERGRCDPTGTVTMTTHHV